MTTAFNFGSKTYQKDITDEFLAFHYICFLGKPLPLTEDYMESFGFTKSKILESLDDFIDSHDSLFDEDLFAITTRLFGYKSMAVLNTENLDGTLPLSQNTRLRDIVYAHSEDDTFTPSSMYIHDHKTTLTHSFGFYDLSSFIIMDAVNICRYECTDRNFDSLTKDEISAEISKVADSRGKGIADKITAVIKKYDLLFDFFEYDAVRYYQIIVVNESPILDNLKLDDLIEAMKAIANNKHENELEAITCGDIVMHNINQFIPD